VSVVSGAKSTDVYGFGMALDSQISGSIGRAIGCLEFAVLALPLGENFNYRLSLSLIQLVVMVCRIDSYGKSKSIGLR
jgi:hypothetical protein